MLLTTSHRGHEHAVGVTIVVRIVTIFEIFRYGRTRILPQRVHFVALTSKCWHIHCIVHTRRWITSDCMSPTRLDMDYNPSVTSHYNESLWKARPKKKINVNFPVPVWTVIRLAIVRHFGYTVPEGSVCLQSTASHFE